MWRLGVEYWMAPRLYLRLGVGSSSVGRERDQAESDEDIDTLGRGEGALLVAGLPVWSWRWGEVNLQVMGGGGFHHGDDVEARYAAFLATCFEIGLR